MSLEFSPKTLMENIPELSPPARLWLAYSGGMDSHVLLHALAGNGTALTAVHVNHGLQPEAPAWERHCAGVCAALGVPLEVARVDAGPVAGESPEEAARLARYSSLAGRLGDGDVLLTAHHLDDQAETVLLRLFRGAGPHGLAAMAPCRPLGRGRHCRPLLRFARESLRRYALAEGLTWVEDPSNRDLSHPRNRLRRQVLPLLAEGWPGVESVLSRAAGHQARSAALLDEVAAADLERAAGPEPGTLCAPALAALDGAHALNLVRYWLHRQGVTPPAERHLEEILRAARCAPDRVPRVAWPGAEVRRFRDGLYALTPGAPLGGLQDWAWDLDRSLDLGHGVLSAVPAQGAGLRADCARGDVRVRLRRGGERCRPADRRHGQTLKRLFQERGVPPWRRDRLPLVFVDGELAAVADLWVCAPRAAAPGEGGRRLVWREYPGAGPTHG